MFSNKYIEILISVLIIFVIAWVGVLMRNSSKEYRYIGQSVEQKHSITIEGEGKVVAIPDIASIQIGYSVEKKTVAQAQKDSTDKVNIVIKKLKEDFNISDKDIKTDNYNIYPGYDWKDGIQILRGYRVEQNLTVKIRDLEKISDILAMVGESGLNQAGGLVFEVDDPQQLKQQARELAIEHAKQKAESLAKVAGVKLGNVINFSEYSNDPIYSTRNFLAKDVALGMGGAEAMPSVEAGSTEIIVNATVEYEIY